MESVVEDLVRLIRHKLDQQQIRLKIQFTKDLPTVRLDRAQIEQALLNIVLNALHAMPDGGTLEISSGRSTENNESLERIWIEIRDSGIGMTDSQRQNLFQPFLTSRATGTGLGMAIVNKIVKAHAGEIVVRSRANRGTSVRILLPVEEPVPSTVLPASVETLTQ
jgi:signal transduction histidine kinase